MIAQCLGMVSQGLGNLAQGLGMLAQTLSVLSQALGQFAQSLGMFPQAVGRDETADPVQESRQSLTRKGFSELPGALRKLFRAGVLSRWRLTPERDNGVAEQ